MNASAAKQDAHLEPALNLTTHCNSRPWRKPLVVGGERDEPRRSSCVGRSGGRASGAALEEAAVKVMQRHWTLLLSRGASASELGTSSLRLTIVAADSAE